MAKPTKQEITFPEWKPLRATLNKIYSSDRKQSYKALANSSRNFVKRDDVRTAVMKKSDGKCVRCGSTKDLHVDHIISIYKASVNHDLIKNLNTYGNLQMLCSFCNASKNP